MITHIRTQGFKGFDLDEDVPQKVIYTGKNKSGKSSRAGAIAIALYGHIPFSTAGKRPGDILDSFGNDSLVCAAKIGGKEFGRKFSRNDKGKVSQGFQIDKKRVSADNFAIELNKAGTPRIADVAEFMKQSETKKIDDLFELYPNPELSSIDTEIENAKADISRIEKKKSGAESTIQRLTQSKDNYTLPAGSIAETQDEINKTEIKIVELEEQIKQAEIEDAEIRAKAEGERRERERAENTKDKQKKTERIELEPADGDLVPESEYLGTDEDWEKAGLNSMPSSPEMVEADKLITKMEKDLESFQSGNIDSPEPFQSILQSDVSDSIERIIDAITQTGCSTCAALIVAKQELKKYRG